MFIDMSGNVILDTGYANGADENGVLYNIEDFNFDSLGAELQ